MNTNHFALPANVELGEYRIVRTLGQGGFGITYLAESIADGKQVVIKENLPTFCAYRNTTSLIVASAKAGDEAEEYRKLLTRFVEEARLLASLNHPNIVKVYTAFEALGTAYYVMPWVGGKELHKAAPAPKDITESWLLPILRQLLGALDYLHRQNIYHRDIKPANILLPNDTTPVIIDFGTARSIISDRSATLVGSPGYSPIEQITASGQRGPWTDIYSLGATCYRLITGTTPPEATERLAHEEDPFIPLINRTELRGRFSLAFLVAIDKALALRAKNRWQTASEWLAALPACTSPTSQPTIIPTPPALAHSINVNKSPRSKSLLLFIPLLLLLIGGLAAGCVVLFYKEQQAQEQRQREEEAKQQEEQKRLEQEQRQREEDAKRQEEEKKRLEQEQIQREEEEKRQVEANEQYQKGANYFHGRNGHEQSYANAIPHLQIAATAGHAEAQFLLGTCFAKEQNYTEAAQWFQKAAQRGLMNAQYSLAVCLENGKGVTQSYNEAISWYKKAAEQGHADAQCSLGSCYENGRGVAQSDSEAANWYKKAALQDNAEAQCNLGEYYSNGKGVTQDYNESIYWFRKAANQGHAKAQYHLGVCYAEGRGTTQDIKEAAIWFKKAADQGEDAAAVALRLSQHNSSSNHSNAGISTYGMTAAQVRELGADYAEARNGKKKNEQQAIQLYIKAADMGDSKAQRWMGWRYYQGRGVKKNDELARMYFQKAANRGDQEAAKALSMMQNESSTSSSSYGVNTYGMSAAQVRELGADYAEARKGKKKNEQLAIELYIQAADMGDAKAQRWMGWRYQQGRGVPKNEYRALIYFQRAANQGDQEAAKALRMMQGSSSSSSSSYSVNTYGMSAAQVRELGVDYAEGRKGKRKNEQQAIQLYIQAANMGDAKAQRWMGWRYREGRGVQKDEQRARAYFRKAANQGDQNAAKALNM